MTASRDKRSKKRTRARLGDVFEIQTSRGLAYGQVINKHPKWGLLIRTFAGFFEKRPSQFDKILQEPTKFQIFYPVSHAASKDEVQIVSSGEIPSKDRQFPTFRGGNENLQSGKVKIWYLWDGEQEWRVGDLTPEQRKFPILELWNTPLLVEKLVADWTPETDTR